MPILWADNLLNTPTWLVVPGDGRKEMQLFHEMDKHGPAMLKLLIAPGVKGTPLPDEVVAEQIAWLLKHRLAPLPKRVVLATNTPRYARNRWLQVDQLTAVNRFCRRTERRVSINADATVVMGQRGRLQRAISNLLDNADKWSPADTTIEVTVSSGRVSVRDQGTGIAESDLPHVFDRFYRAPSARSLPGSGLGLSIVDQVARDHGGSTFVEAADDGGAVVGFQIPLV